MKVIEILSPQEMDNIKGGFWYTLPDGTRIWIEYDDEGSEDPFIMW